MKDKIINKYGVSLDKDKRYIFWDSIDGKRVIDILKDYDKNSKWCYITEYAQYQYIGEDLSEVGTIPLPEIKLLEGECYRFKTPDGTEIKGVYQHYEELFIGANNINYRVSDTTEIKPLT